MDLTENVLQKINKLFAGYSTESRTAMIYLVNHYQFLNGSEHTFNRIIQLRNCEDILDLFAEIRWGLILKKLGFGVEIEPFKSLVDHIKNPDMTVSVMGKSFTVEVTRIRSTPKTNFWVTGLSDGTLQNVNEKEYYVEFPNNPSLKGQKFAVVHAQHIEMDKKKFQIANSKIISKINEKLAQLAGHKYTIVCVWDERDCVDSSIFSFMLQQDQHLWSIFKEMINKINCFCWLTNNSSADGRCMCIPSYPRRHEAGPECLELSRRLRNFANTQSNSYEMRAIPDEFPPKGIVELNLRNIHGFRGDSKFGDVKFGVNRKSGDA